jgi:hypothetical protein
MKFPSGYVWHQKYWTRERVIAALKRAAVEIPGDLPCSDDEWNVIKKGRLDWPPAARIYEYFGSMPRGWIAAGVKKNRISMLTQAWDDDEISYLLDFAGIQKLEDIGKKLNRNYGAVRGQLRKIGIKARDNQGFLSAAQVAKEYTTSYSRVRKLLVDGTIPAQFDALRNRWEVDGIELGKYKDILTAPRRTHKTHPVDVGDYYQRYGIKRINGVRVKV